MKPAMAKRSSCSSSRGFYRLFGVFCMMLWMVLFLPCDGKDQVDGVLNSLLYGRCEIFGDLDSSIETKEGLSAYPELKNVCFESTSLCFPSTLIGLSSDFDEFQSERGEFDLVNLRSYEGSPSLDTWNQDYSGFSSESLLSDYVEINPPMLDWGINNLFTPSLVNLTVMNTHNTSVLHVFEPFSSDPQFYSYGFERMSLAPGEVGSIALVFIPNSLGLVLAHVVLQTTFGGFIIHAKGMATESPYGINPFRGFLLLSDGRLRWNLSLYNSFDDPLYIEEVTAKISIESENASYSNRLICSHSDSFCKSGEGNVPWIEIRHHNHWELPPFSAETIVKLNLWPPVKGNVSGVFCIKLKNYTEDKFQTVVVPLETVVDSRATYNSLSGLVSVFLESLVPWDGRGFVCSLSLRNSALSLLRVVNITEKLNVFKVKYSEGLLLYPDSITHVAFITCDFPDVSEDVPLKIPWMSEDCEVAIMTNDSINPEIAIPCEEIVRMCYRQEVGVGFIEPECSFVRLKSQEEKLTNARSGSLESLAEESLRLKSNPLQLLEADRLILRNWRSHGTMSKLSVLKNRELLFPLVQIGTEFSKWITVQNPSPNPVIVQLVLNSASVINNCKILNDSLLSVETRNGFSLPDIVTTETIMNPFGSAQIGPVLFRPSKQCTWRSSVLIRNNLSGVEWLPLHATGGFHSLLLLDGTEPVKKLEFNLYSPTIHNLSSPNSSFHLSKTCNHQVFKELHAKNAGEHSLEIRKLEVSGSDCGLDGFTVHNCRGFSLAPGELKRLLISYQSEFSVSLVQRELKLVMATGFLAIPMEASLPVTLMDFCNKSPFWSVMWKLSALVVTALFVVCYLFFVLLHPVPSANKEHSVKSEKTIVTINRVEKPSRVHRTTKSARSTKKSEKLEEGLVINRHPYGEKNVQEITQRVTVEKKGLDHEKKTILQSPPPTKKHVGEIIGTDALESQESVNLSVKLVKERGRRRKRRLASKFEVSSSHSGNSTPSSPMSPNGSTPNSSSFSSPGAITEERKHENKQKYSLSMEERVAQPHKSHGRPILLTSASFPGSGARAPGMATSNLLASASPISPEVRAPGSKRNKEKEMKMEEDGMFGKEYTYDIWGNHFCGHLMGKPKEVSSSWVFDASEGDSQSFFTRDPQSLMMISSPPQTETSGHKLTPYDVDYLKQIK